MFKERSLKALYGFQSHLIQRLLNLHQLDVKFKEIYILSIHICTYIKHLTIKQDTETDSLILEDLTLEVIFQRVWCDEYVMIHYNNDNNAYCRAVSAQKFETVEHNTVWISTLLLTLLAIAIHSYTQETHILIHILKYSSAIIVLGVRLTKYQQIIKYIHIYHLLRSKCLHVCLHTDWNPYSTFKFTTHGKWSNQSILETDRLLDS